ncbi:hypothetical protein, partial [Burkholderia stabilis]
MMLAVRIVKDGARRMPAAVRASQARSVGNAVTAFVPFRHATVLIGAARAPVGSGSRFGRRRSAVVARRRGAPDRVQ